MRQAGARAAGFLLVVGSAPRALADEPRVPNEPRMMREPGEVVDVPDAADVGDPIDIEVLLSYRLDVQRYAVVRGPSGQGEKLADLSSLTSRLVPEIRVGIFRDVAGIARLPIVLSQTRDIADAAGPGSITSQSGETLFPLPLRSPERSGVEHFAFGLIAAVMNQTRNPALPNWVVGAEAQIAVGPSLVACNDEPPEGQLRCAHPADVERDGLIGGVEVERDPGIGRGTATLALSTSISKRIRYVEPFGTLRAAFEFPLSGSPLEAKTDTVSSMLPFRGEAEVGLGLIPWENREKFSRVWIDARVVGSVVTRGRDFSPMFDAIGSSDAASLRAPADVGGTRVYETGVTTVAAHGTLGAQSSFIWRASQLIRLGIGVVVKHEFEHIVTDDEPCEDDPGCTTITNPTYRATLDEDDGRFGLASGVVVQLGATGAVVF